MAKTKRNIIFWIIYLAYMSIYIARVNLSLASPDLTQMNLLDSAQIGFLGSCFCVFFALGRMINGSLSDSAAPYKMLTIGLLLTGFSNLLMSLFPGFFGMLVFWMVNAYAQSMLWSSVLCVVTSVYENNTAKKKVSVMVTSVAAGNILGIVLNSFFITSFNVRFAFILPGILAIVLGVLTFFATKDIPSLKQTEAKHLSLPALIKQPEFLKMNVVAIFHGVIKENISLWMAVYIVDTYFVDLTTSSFYILLIPIIGFLGRILYPALYKLCRENEHAVSLLGYIACVASAVVLCFSKVGILASALALGIAYMAVSVINTSVLSIYPISAYSKTGNSASVSGFLDFSTYFGGGVSGAIYGIVIQHCGYLPMFVSWAVISAVSVFILLQIKKKG